MAAGQVVCSFFPVVFERLNGIIKEDHLGPFWGVREELYGVFKDFCKIKGVLADAEQKQFMAGEEAVQFWLKELNEAAYEADDVLDELQVKALQLASQEMGSPKETNFPRHIQEYIKLSKKFGKIAGEINELHLQKGNVEKRMDPGRETSPLPTEPHPYGRDEDREELLKLLLKDDYKSLNRSSTRHPSAQTGRPMGCSAIEKISICSIVGIGGIGKTTLAQMVYNDARVAKYFASKFWVCVSNVFDAERIVKEIVSSFDSSEKLEDGLKKSDSSKKLEDGLKKLSSTRFLLVLDDVWEENQEKWNKFKAFFRAGVGEGSSIIVTTRLQTVADITRTVTPLCIKGLSEEDCLHLFKKYAFGPGNEERPALAEMGKEIVKKCGGLPLAVKALASLLRHKKEEHEWLSIIDSAIWELRPSDVNNILPALMLSYSHLPPLLKPCFVYCSIFPQDYEIDKDDLIQQWMAHSLVQLEAGKELEDVGNEIFNELLSRSFIQDARKDQYGDIISYKMHDRMHDLASYIAGDECSVGGEERSRKIGKITRHFSLPNDLAISSLEQIERASPYLRSLIIWRKEFWIHGNSEFLFPHIRRLRALDLGCSMSIPDCFDEMIHLRYLNLSQTYIKFLPKSICLLRNLQTLKLQGCEELVALPNDMTKMRSLRHLETIGCLSLQRMPAGIGQLSSLRTLNCFIVGSESGHGVTELRGLDLGGLLEIKGLEHVISSTEAKAANLVEKKNIRSLNLYWSTEEELYKQWLHQSQNAIEEETEDEDSQQPQQQQHQEVIDGLQPHAKLRTLSVQGYQGPNSPSWLTPSCVPNLVIISLSYCTRCERLSPLGKLESLKVLDLSYMDSLKFIVMDDDDDARTFRSLEELTLKEMPELEGWSSSSLMQSTLSSSSQAAIGPVFPRLKEVFVERCPKLEGEVPLSGSPVEDVSIEGSSNGMVLGSLHDLHYLHSLYINGFAKMNNLSAGALQNLTALQKLRISHCNVLKTLPVQLKSFTTLTELTIEYCGNLVSLAEGEGGLRNLSSLKTLHIYDCNALKHLPQFHKTSLVDVAITNCPRMEFSTDDFEHLVVLKRLKLRRLPKLTCFPKGGPKNLSSLKTLHIVSCNALKHLPQFHKTSLVTLEIINCPQMEFSTDDFEHLVVLEELTLSRLPKLTCFPKGGLRNLSSLKTLHIDDCNALKHLPQFHKTSLVTLEISNCPQMEFSTDDFEHLVVLEELTLRRLPKLTCFPKGGLRNLSSLKTLHIDDCNALKHLPQFHKTSLVTLEISNCPQMEFSTDDFEHLVVLEKLTLRRLPKLTCFPKGGLTNLSSLKTLHIDDCNALKHLPQFHKTFLVDLEISDCPQMEFSTDDFDHPVVLERLKLHRLPKLTFFPKGGPKNLSSLKTLHIVSCNALKHLPQFHKTSLVTLEISNCPQMEFSTDDFEHLVVLEKLTLRRLPKLTCFPKGGLTNLSSLKTLHIVSCNALKHLPQFHKTFLVDLEISDCPQMEFSTDDFDHPVVLEWLKLHRLPKLTFFPEGIKHTAETLLYLDFQPCSENGAMDLPDWISTLTSLQGLSITAPKNWKMLPQWLQDLTELQNLSIYGCDEELERRWENKDEERGDDCFNMISHVSWVRISSNVWSGRYY